MVTEFEIRRELAQVETARLHGIAKTRSLLRISRRVHRGALTLAGLSLRALQSGDADASARFRVAARRLVDLHDEIRGKARDSLCGEKTEGFRLSEAMA